MSEVPLHRDARLRYFSVLNFGFVGFGAREKLDIRLLEKGYSDSHRARPVHQIISMIKWIRTSRFSIKKSLSLRVGG